MLNSTQHFRIYQNFVRGENKIKQYLKQLLVSMELWETLALYLVCYPLALVYYLTAIFLSIQFCKQVQLVLPLSSPFTGSLPALALTHYVHIRGRLDVIQQQRSTLLNAVLFTTLFLPYTLPLSTQSLMLDFVVSTPEPRPDQEITTVGTYHLGSMLFVCYVIICFLSNYA